MDDIPAQRHSSGWIVFRSGDAEMIDPTRAVEEDRKRRQSDIKGFEEMAASEALAQSIEVTDDVITTHLTDGRTISVPLTWSWRLSDATPAQRRNFRIIGTGQGTHWPDLDEDISVRGMLEGMPARRPRRK